MSEWPKTVVIEQDDSDPSAPYQPPRKESVIPADLGRELYLALKKEYRHGPRPLDENAVEKALARYEREVGE